MIRQIVWSAVAIMGVGSFALCPAETLERIELSEDGTHFICSQSKKKFTPWGFNYDHDRDGRLIEDYWDHQWDTVVEDFWEMKELGANVVRIHLQLARLMKSPSDPNEAALERLSHLVKLAEQTGLYLNLTGLGCYHRHDVPDWYEALDESLRWQVQARFWQAVARIGAGRTAIFCYDLMNEPIIAGREKESDWLAGQFGGKHFVQRIALDRAGRTPEQIAEAWVGTLVSAIRQEDSETLVTVGIIPWALTFPRAEPIFYAPETARHLDFVSVHFYPESGRVEDALTALAVYRIDKPLVIEELFPLKCSMDEMEQFIDASRRVADGWLTFYWGKTIEEYANEETITAAIMRKWLAFFAEKNREINEPQAESK